MIRWMISPIIGDGTINNTFRAAVADIANVNIANLIPTHKTGPNKGQPIFNFALCLVATPSIATISAISNAYVFPDYGLDGRMDGMEAVARAGFEQSVEAYDLDGQGLHLDASHADGDSYRDVISDIGQQFDAAFSINAMSVGEVAE